MIDVALGVVERGWVAESHHRGRLCIVGADGSTRLALGDTAMPTLPRSALKPFQAIAMLECGLDLEGELLALAAASHLGQGIHLEGALRILHGAGLGVADFQHTADLPADPEALSAWLRQGRGKEPLAHNCSGKHAAMLRTCVRASWEIAGYRDPSHPLQQRVREVIHRYCGVIGEPVVDGCTAPAFATSLLGLAQGFSALSLAESGPAHQVAEAFRMFPEFTASTSHPVVTLVGQLPGAVAKIGAEGILAVGLPDGTGIALKLSDGSGRGRFEVIDAILRALGYDVDTSAHEMRIEASFDKALAQLS